MMMEKKIIAVVLLLIFALIPFANAEGDKNKLPFDPAKIPMDENWEEVLLVKDEGGPQWCGPRKIFFRTAPAGARLIDVFTREVKTLALDSEYEHYFMDCFPSGKYIVFKRKYRKKDGKGFDSIAFHDAESNKPIKVLPYITRSRFRQIASIGYSLLSPDGKYMAWFDKGEILLEGEKKITLLPVLRELDMEFRDITWSPDSRKIFFLTKIKPQKLIVYDKKTADYKIFSINLIGYYALELKASPGGKSVYLRAIRDEVDRGNLFRLNLDKLEPTSSIIRPEFLSNAVSTFNFGAEGTMVFNARPPPDSKSLFSFEFAGIYLADMDGNVQSRLTAGHYDTEPIFSKDGNMIAFDRTDPKIPGNWKYLIYVLFRKDR